jgi:hypothetical protein
MLHGKAMAIVVAYDIYKELAEGSLDPHWKVDKPVSFFVFRETLGQQMLQYNPKDVKYLGDAKFRANTITNKSKRSLSPMPPPIIADDDGGIITTTAAGVTADTFLERRNSARMCGFLGDITDHRALRSLSYNKWKTRERSWSVPFVASLPISFVISVVSPCTSSFKTIPVMELPRASSCGMTMGALDWLVTTGSPIPRRR